MAVIGFLLHQEEHQRALRRERVFRERQNLLEILDDVSLIERYRLPRHLIVEILNIISPTITRHTKRSHAVNPTTQLLVTLRYYSKGGFLSEIGDLHGISRSTASRCITAVTNEIYAKYHVSIKFPSSIAEIRDVKEGCYRIARMPNVVGAIDGTLIPIQSPSVDEHVFVCRKGYHALNVQAICTYNMKFINVICKWPGSVHDSFILSNSEVGTTLENEMDGWLLGDSGYPLRPWLLTPVTTPASRSDEMYNRSHMKTRNVVERAFGMLKSRFRCLHKTTGCIMFAPPKACKVVYV
ncbi:putative nuclease HARBI1 [Pecten maximus]|uniref:putative nuclease HARBI1 n=1 Tax=Pecten maximus TaxID=6579 RepID=UPI00145896E8|nr:putative nuclease HARBI1 [Pecten maximus]